MVSCCCCQGVRGSSSYFYYYQGDVLLLYYTVCSPSYIMTFLYYVPCNLYSAVSDLNRNLLLLHLLLLHLLLLDAGQ